MRSAIFDGIARGGTVRMQNVGNKEAIYYFIKDLLNALL